MAEKIIILLTTHLFIAFASLPLSITTTDDALAILQNPAFLATDRSLNFYLFHNHSSLITQRPETISERYLSLALQLKNIGFFYQDRPRTYYLGSGLRFSNLFFGLRYEYEKKSSWDLGLAYRHKNLLSLGLVLTGWKKENPFSPGVALRPIKGLSLFYEALIYRQPLSSAHFFGFEITPCPGLAVRFKSDENLNFSAGLSLTFGNPGLGGFFSRALRLKAQAKTEGFYFSYHQDLRPSLLPQPKRYLELELRGGIGDLPPGFSLFGQRRGKPFYEIIATIERAKESKEISALLIKVSPDFSPSLAQLEELKRVLAQFKTGKKVYLYTPELNHSNFSLAGVADKVIIHPLGNIVLAGIYLRSLFLANLLRKLGIEVEVERVGRYKSAPEVFTEEKLSEENRRQLSDLLDDMYEVILLAFQERGISRTEAEEIISQGIFLPREGKEKNLLDLIAYEDKLDSIIKKETKATGKIKESVFKKRKSAQDYWGEKDKIAIVYINGPIAYGESQTDLLTGEYTTGCQTIARFFQKIKNNPRVKAVILRIDSPGGDGLASDIIWREVEVLKRKKPVYASFSSLSASGGYYVACGANEIFALNSTITGSIGVFGMKMVTKDLREKVGIKEEVLKRGEKADCFSSHRPFTEEERRLFRKVIEEFYDQFLTKVAEGRDMKKEVVDSLAQGRIWSGRRAKELGLCDAIGGLKDLLDYIKEKHRLRECEILHYPPLRPTGFFNLW